MASTLGTIAEYDVVLSVSQDAINKQMQLLYDHRIPAQFVPKPTRIKGGARAAPANYAINHDWNIQVETYEDDDGKDVLDPDIGIWAHIECPKIQLGGGTKDKPDIGSATITIKFRHDDTATEDRDPTKHKSKDSLYYYYRGPPGHAKLASVNINGWSISWQASIRQHDIQNSMQEIVNRTHDQNDPVYVLPGLSAQLQTIDPQLFTVSSIFCLFEDKKFTDTFSITDQNGKPPDMTRIQDFTKALSKYFQGMSQAAKDDGKPIDGLSTPDNPFVLGYGLMQKTQSLSDVNPNATWKDTPACFIPWRFDLTTKRSSVSDGFNTLNYCILTHTTKNSGDTGRNVSVITNLNAGNLDSSFFEITSPAVNQSRTADIVRQVNNSLGIAGIGGHINDPGHALPPAKDPKTLMAGDAIMAWSQGVFWNKYVSPIIAPTFFIDPGRVIRDWKGGDFETDRWDGTLNSSPGHWENRIDFKTKDYHVGDEALYRKGQRFEGHSHCKVTVQSDLTRSPNAMSADSKRAVYITADVSFRLEVHFVTYAKGPVGDNPDNHNAWYTSAATANYHYAMVLQAGSGGTWTASWAPDSVLPKFENNQIKFDNIGERVPGENEYGSFIDNHSYNNVWHPLTPQTNDTVDKFRAQLTDKITNVERPIIDQLGKYMDGLKTTIMMPGGEVFTFSGLDTDNSCNLYAHVHYALGADGVSQTH